MSFKDLLMHVGGKKYPVKIEVYEYIESLRRQNSNLQSKVEQLAQQVIYEFSEDQVSIFRQGPPVNALQDIVTAERCTGLINKIEQLNEKACVWFDKGRKAVLRCNKECACTFDEFGELDQVCAAHYDCLSRLAKDKIEQLTQERIEAVDGWARWEARAIEIKRERDLAQRENNIWKMRRDRAEAQAQKLKEALRVANQALLEIDHAYRNGPDWYTKGESGLRQQARMWIDKGIAAINKALQEESKNREAQKYEDKLTRCSAMFDEVENALAASCRREEKLKEALDEIDDYEADNPPPTAGEKRPATDIQRIIRKAIAQEALQRKGKEETNNNKEMNKLTHQLFNGVRIFKEKESKEKVNLPGFQLDDKYPNSVDIKYSFSVKDVAEAIQKMFTAIMHDPVLRESAPDLSKCPNCGGPADNGNDRCVPPNVYNCTKCTEAVEDDKYPVFKTHEVIDIDTGKIICTLPIIGEGKLPTYRCYIRPVIKAAEDDKYPALAPGPTLKPEEPDLSKCPNCGGPADNGNDRCVPPNAYNCTKCTKSEED